MFNKITNLFFYIKTLKAKSADINRHFISLNGRTQPYEIKAIKVDNAYRLYTVLNFNNTDQYMLEKYGHEYISSEIQKFIRDISSQLDMIGLRELYGLTTCERIAEKSFLVVIEYRYISVAKMYRMLIILSLLSILSGFILLK